jgi:hypothetical protein
MNRDYYKVLLVGQSGRGKTFSFRNMNPETTGFINSEDKPLPFKNKFLNHSRPKTVIETKAILKQYAADPAIKSICFDSLSSYMDLLLSECRETKKGFDIWMTYADELAKFLKFIKSIEKEVFLTAHYEILGIEGSPEKRVKSKGKEFEGMIEKDFTVVLYADNKFDDKGVPQYFLNAVGEGTSAKCPPDLLGAGITRIDNDCQKVFEDILEFVK